jgi:8-oxo-dGTP diphosphatase
VRDRSASSARRAAYSVDVVLVTPFDRHLAVLLVRAPDGALERWALPWSLPRPSDSTLEDTAVRVARSALPSPPAWLEQTGAFADGRRHPGEVDLSVAFVGAVPVGTLSAPGEDAAWFPVAELQPLAPRQRAIVSAAVESVRLRLDYAPVAFRLLPPTFTLSDLQRVYEILIGHRLHKASFRRALHGASLVEATDEWRNEGRGRPAQLFRHASKRRRVRRRGVRFDLLP